MFQFCTEGTTAIGEREPRRTLTEPNCSQSWIREVGQRRPGSSGWVGLRSTCGLELPHAEMQVNTTCLERRCYLDILVACLTPGSRLAPPDLNAREHDPLVEPASSAGARPLAFSRGTEFTEHGWAQSCCMQKLSCDRDDMLMEYFTRYIHWRLMEFNAQGMYTRLLSLVMSVKGHFVLMPF